MSSDTGIESIFKDHSFEEIETVRDNLANEIEQKTHLLKSIVKEKYRDVVETSDAIHSMKLNLKQVEQSLWSLDRSISEFFNRLREPDIEVDTISLNYSQQTSADGKVEASDTANVVIKQLLELSNDIWNFFDAGNLRDSIKTLNESMQLLKCNKGNCNPESALVFDELQLNLTRAEEMIKRSIWHRIQTAASDQVGIMVAGCDDDDLYRISLVSSISFLVDEFKMTISDTSLQAQIKRYQPCSYFNSQTGNIELEFDISKTSVIGYVQIPKLISPELDRFLYNVCKIINTIAGLNLSRTSIIFSLQLAIEQVLDIYAKLVPLVDEMKVELKRRRALQLNFDLLYVRLLLNSSKCIDLIEKLDPKITELTSKFEAMMDSIELYMISSALHTNIVNLSNNTIRLYGLLIPHLQ